MVVDDPIGLSGYCHGARLAVTLGMKLESLQRGMSMRLSVGVVLVRVDDLTMPDRCHRIFFIFVRRRFTIYWHVPPRWRLSHASLAPVSQLRHCFLDEVAYVSARLVSDRHAQPDSAAGHVRTSTSKTTRKSTWATRPSKLREPAYGRHTEARPGCWESASRQLHHQARPHQGPARRS